LHTDEQRPHVTPDPTLIHDRLGDTPRSAPAPTTEIGDQPLQRAPSPRSLSVPLRHLVYALLATIAIAIVVSGIVAVIIERSLSAPPVVAPIQR
jgi:hypothetical protein